MKKKIALLLVLSMILSLVPMNVFGAAPNNNVATPSITRGWRPVLSGNNWIAEDDLWVSAAEFIPLAVVAHDNPITASGIDTNYVITSGSSLVPGSTIGDVSIYDNSITDFVSISIPVSIKDGEWKQYDGKNKNHAGYVTLVNSIGQEKSGGSYPNAAYLFRVVPNDESQAFLTIFIDATGFKDPDDEVTLAALADKINLGGTSDLSKVAYFDPPIYSNGGTMLLYNYRAIQLKGAVATGGFTVGVNKVGNFSTYAYLNSLEIREQAVGALTGNAGSPTANDQLNVITFWAPDNYRWITPAIGSQPVQGKNAGNTQYPFGYSTLNTAEAFDLKTNVDADSARYFVTTDRRYLIAYLPVTGTGAFRLPERLGLSGIGLVADDRAGLGDVSVKYYVESVGSDMTANFDKTYTQEGTNSDRWRSFVAATRSYNDVEFDFAPDASTKDVRTGAFGQELAKVRLKETAANAWGGSLGYEVKFGVPDGVLIESAKVTVTNGTGAPILENKEYRVTDANTDIDIDKTNYQYYNLLPDANGVLVTPYELRYTPTTTQAGQFWNDRYSARYIDVVFKVTAEPDYANKYGTDEINVTVSGISTANLAGPESVLAGRAVDPVAVEVEGGVAITADNYGYNTNVMDIGDITISEADYGKLEKGKQLWVYVIGNVPGEVVFTCDEVADVNTDNSELVLARGKQLRYRWSNNTPVYGMTFVVERQSREKNRFSDSAPGVITITGGKITGPVYPGVDYKVVVSGNAIAENNYNVYDASGNTFDHPAALQNSYRLFDAAPYAYSAFEYEAPAPADNGNDAPAVLVPQGTLRAPLTLNEWSPAINGYKPFVMAPYNANASYGAVSAKVFADHVGGEASWDASTSTATITGTHLDGSAVTVTLTSGSASATINGETVDIATASLLNYAPGSVTPYLSPDNAMYLPLRFLCNAFGITPEWNASTSTVTIR